MRRPWKRISDAMETSKGRTFDADDPAADPGEAFSSPGIVYKSYFARGGGGLGGWVFSRVGGSKALNPHPSYNSEGFLGWAPATPSFFGHRSLVWLFAALFCFVVVQVAGVQVAVFQMGDLFFDNI